MAVTHVAVFDLDGTLTWRDTFVGFLAGYARRQGRGLRALRLPAPLLAFALHRDRGLLKQALIQLFMQGDARDPIQCWAREYAADVQARGLRPAGLDVLERHRAAGDHVVLLSASPDLYVPLIGERLQVHRVICTEVRWSGDRLDGRLASANRRGEEKVRCLRALRAEFPGARFSAYGNAASDLAHLALVDEPLLVNADAGARAQAAALRIPVADWR